MSHKESIISEYNGGENGAHLIDRKRADKNIHEYGAEHAVNYDGISVCIFRGQYVKKEVEWIKHRCLYIGDKGRARQLKGIPQGDGTMAENVISNELL